MPTDSYPQEIAIQPVPMPIRAVVTVPGSKSITNRALILASQLKRQGRPFRLTGALQSEDTEVMIDSLRLLGIAVEVDGDLFELRRPLDDRLIPARNADLFVANSGTSMRFLTALVAAGEGEYRLDGVPRMRQRPIQDLLTALQQLGVDARSEAANGCPPVQIHSSGLSGGSVRIRADVSSQFLSALLMATPSARGPVTIEVDGGLVSESYVEMTVAMMRQFGWVVDCAMGISFRIVPGPSAGPEEYAVEPDASAASYFFAAAAVTGGTVTVLGLGNDSLQGDVGFVHLLEQMGCRLEFCESGVTVHGRPLSGIDVDMNSVSDTVMTLGAVACFADGPTTIRNVGHIRHKETDRINALATELRKAGAIVEEWSDGMTIHPGPLRAAAFDTYNDHRMAMSLALIGLRVPGIVVRDPKCVAKTYPGFWEDFERIRS